MHRKRPAALAALLIAWTLACASPARAIGDRIDVQIVDRDTGETMTPILHDGAWWIAGRPGARYAVVLNNRGEGRTLNVLSIDGVNAISGDDADWSQTGYVLDTRERTEVAGWRKNERQIAAFAFTALPDSYAARTGRAANVGVIGVAVFDERRRLLPIARTDDIANGASHAMRPLVDPRTVDLPASADTTTDARRAAPDTERAKGAVALAPRDRLGTGHGEIESSTMRFVDFRRAQNTPVEIVTIHYDRLENLIAMGVVTAPVSAMVQAPLADPFPKQHRFVPDPPR